MTPSRPSRRLRSQVTQTLANARQLLADGRFDAVTGALERLVALTTPEALRDREILLAYGQGASLAASRALYGGDPGNVLLFVAAACQIMERLAVPPHAATLGRDIMAIPLAVSPKLPHPRPFYDELCLNTLAVLDPSRVAGRSDDPFQNLLDRSGALPESSPLPDRVLLSVVLMGIGHEASERGDTGRAVLAYRAGLRWIEPMAEPIGYLMAMDLFQPLAFELQRGGDWAGMQDILARYYAYLDHRPELDDEERAQTIQLMKLNQQLSLASQSGDIRERTRAVQEITERLGPEGIASLPREVREMLKALSGSGEALHTLALPTDMRGHPLSGFPGLVEADRLIRRNDFRAVLQLLAVALPAADADYNHWAAWRSAAMLARIFAGGASPLLSAVFGKLTIRIVEHARLEAVSRGLPFLSMLNDNGTEDTYRAVAGRLVEQGRLGEALRIELLLEQIEDKIPVPRANDVSAAVDERCPFTAVEQTAMGVLDAIAANPVNRVVSWNPLTRFRQRLQVARLRNLDGDLTKHTRFASPAVADWAELAALPPQTAALGIFDTGSAVFVSVIQGGQSRRTRLAVESATLHQSVYAAMRALRTRSHDAVACCQALYELVLAPIEDWFGAGPQALVVQASGALRHVPFGVLFDGARFLIERYAIVMHPGSQPIVADRGLRLPIRGLSLAISRTPGEDSLPQARAECEGLERLVREQGAGSVTPVFDGDATAATLDALLAERPNLLHLSCHFEAEPSDAGRSAFLLGDGTRYSLARLAGLDLSSIDLCLLSACETRAMGDMEGVSGITALDSLLLWQGVGSIVSTAWRVRDHNAHRFMTTFATAMVRDGRNQAEALRAAVMALGRRGGSGAFEHPHEWGAFTLSGGWGGVVA
jgi:CHAT domain-containing protein